MMKIKKWVCICLCVVAAWKLSVSFHNIFFTWNYQKVGQRDVIFFSPNLLTLLNALALWMLGFFSIQELRRHIFVTSFTDLFILLNLNQKWNWKWRWLRHWLGPHHDCIRLLQKWPISGFDGIPCFTVLLKKVQIVNKHAHLFGSFVLARSQNIITHEFYSLINRNQFWFWFRCLEIWIHFFHENRIFVSKQHRPWYQNQILTFSCACLLWNFLVPIRIQQKCWLLSYNRSKCQDALLRIIIIEWWRKKNAPRSNLCEREQTVDGQWTNGWMEKHLEIWF